MFGEAEAPFVEEASRAQRFCLSFQSAGTLSSAFGCCLGIDVWNVMQQGGGKFKRGSKMENRRSWPKRASCASSLVCFSHFNTEASAPEWQLPVQSVGRNCSSNCRVFPPLCCFKQALIAHVVWQIQLSFCLELFEATEIEKDFWERLLCIIFFPNWCQDLDISLKVRMPEGNKLEENYFL